MPVRMAHDNARKFFWVCLCGKTMGQWSKEKHAAQDYDRHKGVCSLNVRRSN